MKYAAPCQQWADKLLASHARALSPSDYLLLKEHLLTCSHCMAAHCCYLSVEAQLHTMSVLQPQRQLSAKLLLETEAQKSKVWLPGTARWAEIAQKRTGILLATYSARLKNLVIALLRPGYALIVLLFCLLTTVVGIGAMNYGSHSDIAMKYEPHSDIAQRIQPPRLVASTTGITLNIVTDFPDHLSNPHTQAIPLLAYATFTLRNAGVQSLIWDFNRTRSVIFSPYNAIMISTQPSHGVLKGNAYSSVLIIASGISYEQLAFNGTGDLAHIVFTSNGGDVSLQATLKKPTTVVPGVSSTPQSFSGVRNPAPLSTRSDYLLRRQIL